jgi:phosphoribosylformylglycinamidine synthase
MLPNVGLGFRCQWLHVRVDRRDTPFTAAATEGQVLRLPIAHGDGNYHAPPELLARLEDEGRIVFRYCDEAGAVVPEANPNGSLAGIAGICGQQRNVVGLMPHPERASEADLGSEDGVVFWASLLQAVTA